MSLQHTHSQADITCLFARSILVTSSKYSASLCGLGEYSSFAYPCYCFSSSDNFYSLPSNFLSVYSLPPNDFYSRYLWMQHFGCNVSVWIAFDLLVNILLSRINKKAPSYSKCQGPESLPPHLPVWASLTLSALYKQPQPLPKPTRGHISSLTSVLPHHVVFESFLSFRCGLWRGASPPDEAHDHRPLTHPAHAAPLLRPPAASLLPHRLHSSLPRAEAILSPHVPRAIFIQLSFQTACLGRGRPEQQPGFPPGDQPPPSRAFPCSPGRHQHRPSRQAKGFINPLITLQLSSLFIKC